MKVPRTMTVVSAAALTALALTAFAGNSILCRMALRTGDADAIGFTVVRLITGVIALVGISFATSVIRGTGSLDLSTLPRAALGRGTWRASLCLFIYAISFSLAYLGLTAGTGALILFGCVQLTMIAASLFRGEAPGKLETVGLLTAFAGLVYLVLPGLASPPLHSSLLMAAAGIAWGLYTLAGRGSSDPLAETTGNFVRTLPLAALLMLPLMSRTNITSRGLLLATLSGAVTSGIGYTVWYAALKHHTPLRAGVLQLAVPVLTALIGIVFLSEVGSQRLTIAATAVLGGIGLTILTRKHR